MASELLKECINCGVAPCVTGDDMNRRVYWCPGCNNFVKSHIIDQARAAWQGMNEDLESTCEFGLNGKDND